MKISIKNLIFKVFLIYLLKYFEVSLDFAIYHLINFFPPVNLSMYYFLVFSLNYDDIKFILN